MLHSLLLSVFVASDESLILTSEQHDTLFVFHLCLDFLLIEGFDLLSLQIEIYANQVNKLLDRVDLGVLMGLLWANHLLQLTAQVTSRLELLSRDETLKLSSQISYGLQVRDLPVQEATHIGHACQLETEELTVKLKVLLRLSALIVVHALRNEHVLASVDHFVDLALDVAELILLLIELIRLSQLLNIARKAFNMVCICRILHLKIVVVLDQSLDLLLKSLLIHSIELVL